VKLLISRRRLRSEEAQREQICLDRFIHQARTVWHGVKTFSPDWGDSSHSLAFEAELTGDNMRIYIILNAYWEPLQFELPAVKPGLSWRRWIDTTLDSPEDIVDWQDAPALSVKAYPAGPRSVVVLCSTVTE
jgi:glycogen operon protein